MRGKRHTFRNLNIKYRNKVRLAKYILEHNGVEVDPRSIFDVQVKRLHEYKRQLLNILHIMYLYNQIKDHPEMSFYPRTFIFGAKAAAGYRRAKAIIKLINNVGETVMTSVGAVSADTHPTGSKIHVIHQHKDLFCRDAVKIRCFSYGFSGKIHISQRLHQEHSVTAHHGSSRKRTKA